MIEIVIMIASLLVLVELYRERSRIKFNKNLFIIFVAFLLIVGGIRIEGKETAQSFFNDKRAAVYPDSSLFQWAVLENDSDRFHVHEFNSFDDVTQQSSSFPRLNISPAALGFERAFDLAENLPQVKLFRWRAYAIAINASEQKGSWLLEYYDPVVKLKMINAGRIIGAASRGYGSVRVKVENDEARVI